MSDSATDALPPLPELQGLRILPLGGLGEIGMNCMVLEWQDEVLVIDCGLMFSDLDHFGVQFVIPDFSYLRSRKDKVKGVLITHGHEDHIGALAFLLKAGIRAPIYASEFTAMMIQARLREYGLEDSGLRPFKIGERIEDFKHFKVQTVSVNHSIIDSAALIIDTPVGKVVHTGDFKIDATPFYGERIDESAFREAGDAGVILLMSDSTNVERHTHTLSESVIYQKFEQLFAAAEGLTIVAMFSSNIGRMGQIFELAERLGKRVALSGRSMEQNARLAIEQGYLRQHASVLIPMDRIGDYPRRDVILISSGSQAEQGSALSRVAIGEHGQIQVAKGDTILLSSRYIPGNEKAIGRMINNLFKQGADVLYEAVHEIHVSGHATRPELKMMMEWTRPRFFIPIHGEYRHLVHHANLADEFGIAADRVVLATNGDAVETDGKVCRKIGRIEEPRVLIEGREGNDITRLVLKDRRQLGEKGVVFSMLVRNAESRQIISGPQIIARGLVSEAQEGWLIEEAKKVVAECVRDYEKELASGAVRMDLQETIRVSLRRFFNNNIGKKPTVLPIILDL